MINVDSHSFNNNVLEQINKIKTALSRITPDNVKYFDDSLLRKARGVVNQPDEYKWNINSNINSINVGTIKGIINKLKVSSCEYVVMEECKLKLINNFGEDDSQKKLVFSYKYNVPDKFDGRNSFVKHVLVENVSTSSTAYPQYVNELEYLTNVTNSSFSINRNASYISIEGSIPRKYKYNTGELREINFGVYLTVLLWRKK